MVVENNTLKNVISNCGSLTIKEWKNGSFDNLESDCYLGMVSGLITNPMDSDSTGCALIGRFISPGFLGFAVSVGMCNGRIKNQYNCVTEYVEQIINPFKILASIGIVFFITLKCIITIPIVIILLYLAAFPGRGLYLLINPSKFKDRGIVYTE